MILLITFVDNSLKQLDVLEGFHMPTAYHGAFGPIVDVEGRAFLFPVRQVKMIELSAKAAA